MDEGLPVLRRSNGRYGMMAEIIRGTIDGKQKYCRIPIRSKLAETIMDDEDTELSAEKILAMPHDKAAAD